MADFILVHGAWHGAWCWSELIEQLERLGHAAHAIDLPGGGQDATSPAAVTLQASAERVADEVRHRTGKVWLVGHSMGGISVAQAAELVSDRLAGVVYVAAALPVDGQALSETFAADADASGDGVFRLMVIDHITGCGAIPAERRRALFYHLCSDEQVEEAERMLRELQPLAPGAAPVRISAERGGSIPRFYVECLQDRAIPIDLQRRMQRAAGVSGVATLDSDHSPFLSRPQQLAVALDEFVQLAGKTGT